VAISYLGGYFLITLFFTGLIAYSIIKKDLSPEGAIALVFIFTYGLALPLLNGYGRYYMPVLPLIYLVAFFSFNIIELIKSKKLSFKLKLKLLKFSKSLKLNLKILVPSALIIITMITNLSSYYSFKLLYIHNVYSMNVFNVRLAEWLINNTSPDDIIGTCDIGATSFIANRRLIDTNGLINPEIADFNGTYLDFLRYHNASYFIHYPLWVENDVKNSPCNETVFKTIYLGMVTITAGPQMVIYKCNWS
jgi:hypothetical protein